MVINKDPDWDRKKAARERANQTEDEQKENMLDQMRQESIGVIALALMYAKNFEELGYDVTRCIITANQNTQILEAAYNKGYEDGLSKGRRLGHEEYKRNKDLHDGNGGGFNG